MAEKLPQSDAARQAEDEDRAQDHALIRAAQAGDEAAFEALYRRHGTRALRVARGLTGDLESASDLVQEAFLRVFRNLENFDFEHGFATWLYRIVTNLGIDHLRRRRGHVSTTRDEDEGEIDLPDPQAEDPSAGLVREDVAGEVRSVLDSLAEHFRSVLVLREIDGLPCEEIARIVGSTHVTVRWRLHRGRKLFQEEWERRQRLAESGRGANTGQDPYVDPGPGPAEGNEA